MARTPIQLTPPTFEPGFSARAFAAGGESGARAASNVVSLVETASRERIARLNAAMRAQELSAQERMFLEEQKNDTNQFLQELDLRREQQAQEIQNRVQLQNSEQTFRKEMASLTGEEAAGKIRSEQLKSIQNFSQFMEDGGSLNDPEGIALANKVSVTHGQIQDVMERAQWNEAGGGDPSDFNWHKAQARGNDSAAAASWREFNSTLASVNALEQRVKTMRNVPGLDAQKEHSAGTAQLAEALGIYNTFMDRAGKPRKSIDFGELEHVSTIESRERQIAEGRSQSRMTQWGAGLLTSLEERKERTGSYHRSPLLFGTTPQFGSQAQTQAYGPRVTTPGSVMTNAVRSVPTARAVTRTGATSPVQPQPAQPPAQAPAAPLLDTSIPRRSASAQSFSDAMDEIRRAGLRHAETDIRF